MSLRSLDDCFHDELRDILSAEKQLTRALPKMARHASTVELQTAFEDHLKETETHVERLEKVFGLLDRSPRSKKCEGMEGLIHEGSNLFEEEADPEVLDAMLIAAAQKVEHYEIATYGTLCTWAKLLGFDEALSLLKETLAEEKAADQTLSDIAIGINREAMVA